MFYCVNINPGHSTGQYIFHKNVYDLYPGDKGYIEFSSGLQGFFSILVKMRLLRCEAKKANYIYYANSRSLGGLLRDFFILWTSGALKSKKIILHNHGSEQLYFLRFSITNIFYNILISYSFKIIFLSKNALDTSKLWKKNKRKVSIIENYVPNGSRMLGTKNRGNKILFVSNFIDDKGFMSLYHFAMNNLKLLKEGKWKIELIGSYLNKQQRKKLEKLNNDVINFCGPASRSIVQKKMQCAKVFIFPSKYKVECQPLVVLEAVMSGCVVYSTNINNFLNGYNFLGVNKFDNVDNLFKRFKLDIINQSIKTNEDFDLAQTTNFFSEHRFLKKLMDLINDT